MNNNGLCTCGSQECDPDSLAHFNRMRDKDNHANEGEYSIFSVYGSGSECNGLCDPMCSECLVFADEAADNRVIDQGY